MQWMSLVLLFAGVALVQLDTTDSSKGVAAGLVQNKTIGMTSVLMACLMSGFAGIYFEKVFSDPWIIRFN